MHWKEHDKWAQRLGISAEISNYVNSLIDVIMNGTTLPQEYLDFVETESQKEANSKSKAVSKLIEDQILKHDSARKNGESMRALTSRIQLRFLNLKGKDYVKAWYLHHALDYLADTEEWRNNTAENVEECIDKYQKNKPETYSSEIANFLKDNIEELEKDLGL